MFLPLLALAASWHLSTAESTTCTKNPCSPSCLKPSIEIPNNGKILDLSADVVNLYPVISGSIIDFCNVTLTYTHPGRNDTINMKLWLPKDKSNWNERFQGTGGAAYAGDSGTSSMAEGVANKYSTGQTDTGHTDETFSLMDTTSWYRKADGELNIPLFEDYATIALNDLAVVGKQITHGYYGKPPVHSFWNGCSTGGRQGLQVAQKYPTAYNAIYAGSPAINFPELSGETLWSQFVMNWENHWPPSCVQEHFTNAVIKACDKLDGVEDQVIAALDKCHFDPYSLVNQTVLCGIEPVKITAKDATVVQKSWQGARTPDGSFLWYGVNPGAALSVLSGTSCSGSATNCTGAPTPIGTDWFRHWLLNDPNYDLTSITWPEYVKLFNESVSKYDKIIGTNDPDLSEFNKAGGKMITWHGMADPLIPEKGTVHYYKSVEAQDPNVRDYYRFFEAPGVSHCGGGDGAVPQDPFDAVVKWFENGTVPETLKATNGLKVRDLCLYPKVSVYKGGDTNKAESYECQDGW